jgi:hypothetical protein
MVISVLRMNLGNRRAIRYWADWNRMLFQRLTTYAGFAGSVLFIRTVNGSTSGSEPMYVGERCSIVTCPAPELARAGINVTAVAPLPMTTISLPS